MDQIATKLLIRTEITNKKIEVTPKISSSLSQLKRRKCKAFEKEILKVKFKINSFQLGHVIESSRIRIGSKIFHSKIYNRKGSINSYTICFDNKNKTEFGEIQYFFEHEEQVFAKLNVFTNLNNYVQPEKITSYFYEIFEKSYNQFYYLVDKDKCREDIILADEIKNKCIMINYMKNVYHVTNVVYDYEHD